MRPVCAVFSGLVGLGLLAPAAAQASDENSPCPKCESGEGHGIFHRIKHKHVHTQPTHVCARCMKKIEEMGAPVDGTIVSTSPAYCPNCQATMASASAPLILEKGETIVVEGAPGMAVVDNRGQDHGAMPQPGVMAEPEPVGVMRTAYSDAGTMKPAQAPAAAVTADRPGYASVNDVKHDASWRKKKAKAQPSEDRESAVRDTTRAWSHLFLPHTGAIREARRDRAKSEHAQIRYDDQEPQVSSLPVRSVYGR